MSAEQLHKGRISAILTTLRNRLVPFEDGTMHISEMEAGKPWVDITQRYVDEQKTTIAIYEAILEKLAADKTS